MQNLKYFSKRAVLSIVSAGASATTCYCILSISLRSFDNKLPEDIKKYVGNYLQNFQFLQRTTLCDSAEIPTVSATVAWPFDAKGMKTTIHPRFQPLNSPPLLLVGVGMRKKTFLFIDVDVYLIAINISSNELRRAKFWNNTAKESLSDVLLAENSQEKIDNVKVSATITFMREITQQQLLDAFDVAFNGCERVDIELFKDRLRSCLGTGNLKKGGTITFYWLPKGVVYMSVDEGENIVRLQSSVIVQRLLDVYIHKDRSVSPELVTSLETNIPRVSSST